MFADVQFEYGRTRCSQYVDLFRHGSARPATGAETVHQCLAAGFRERRELGIQRFGRPPFRGPGGNIHIGAVEGPGDSEADHCVNQQIQLSSEPQIGKSVLGAKPRPGLPALVLGETSSFNCARSSLDSPDHDDRFLVRAPAPGACA